MSRRFYQAFSLSAAALLSVCGGLPQTQVNVPLADAPGAAPQNVEHLKNNKSFAYTGAAQTFIVPAGVRRLTVVARGGRGSGTFYPPSYAPGGFPGRVYSVIRVRPGEKLYVFVGASGDNGGWNGGGAGGTAGYGGGTGNRGGGASDVRVGGDKLKNRIIVAAGGGGSGSAFSYCYAPGGDGGGLSGKPGGGDGYSNSGGGGGGGTQSKGGSGGSGGLGDKRRQNGQPGDDAALGRGGNGGNGGPGNNSYAYGLPGGGGGGGYYGGGGGGGSSAGGTDHYENSQGGGGGGGSSYVEPSAIKFRMWPGFKAEGDGLVTFSWN